MAVENRCIHCDRFYRISCLIVLGRFPEQDFPKQELTTDEKVGQFQVEMHRRRKGQTPQERLRDAIDFYNFH